MVGLDSGIGGQPPQPLHHLRDGPVGMRQHHQRQAEFVNGRSANDGETGRTCRRQRLFREIGSEHLAPDRERTVAIQLVSRRKSGRQLARFAPLCRRHFLGLKRTLRSHLLGTVGTVGTVGTIAMGGTIITVGTCAAVGAGIVGLSNPVWASGPVGPSRPFSAFDQARSPRPIGWPGPIRPAPFRALDRLRRQASLGHTANAPGPVQARRRS